MQAKIKLIQSQVGFRFQSMVFNEDGSLNINIQIGTISESQPENEQSQVTFHPIAQQGHWLQKNDVDSALNSAEIPEGTNLRDALELKVQAVLVSKGLLPA